MQSTIITYMSANGFVQMQIQVRLQRRVCYVRRVYNHTHPPAGKLKETIIFKQPQVYFKNCF